MQSIYDSLIPMIPPFIPIHRVQILAAINNINHQLMNIPEIWKKTKGSGVKVAVLDTGVSIHNDLSPVDIHSFVKDEPVDLCGHGTHCAGLLAGIGFNDMGILGIAPEVSDYYVKILDNSGSGTTENVIKGIYYAVDELGVQVINMSLGISTSEKLDRLEKVCDYAASKNVIICAAAGNEHGIVSQPAMYDSVLAISSISNQETLSNFSNFGDQIDYCAVGENLYSTYLNNGYCTMSGTSMASPIIAGVIALILSDAKNSGKELSRSEAIEKLDKIAFDIGPEGLDSSFGHGIPIFKPITEEVK
jgi:subtilisin